MQSTDIVQPTAISQAVATNGTKNDIPESATGSNLASIYEGFPDITMKTLENGGLPPFGQDFNGLFYLSTDQRVYLQNGGIITFSDDVSNAIGGYPAGAILDYINSDGDYCKVKSLIDDNTYNFIDDSSYINDEYWSYVLIAANRSLSNLTDTGLDKINQSKALETGALSSDSDVYADVYSYAHSTFDSSKFTVVGDVTITDDGIASGFEAAVSYLNTTYYPDLTQNFKLILPFTVTQDFLDYEEFPQIIYSCYCTDNERIVLEYSGSSLNLACRIMNTKVIFDSLSLALGDEITIVYDYENTGDCTITLYRNGVQENSGSCTVDDTDYIFSQPFSIGSSLQGSSMDYTPYASIDLKQFRIEVDGVTAFTGNQTGTDTYTIDDETIEIPYTLSKTGSKIVEYDYIDSVQAVYDEYGCAPYYTIDEDNEAFTLPMGEVYGMINKIPANTALDNLTDTGVDLIRCVTDGVYEPVDLTEKFADEIANYSSEWTWIQARIQAADFSGIHIGDYIPVTLTGGSIGSDYEITENQVHNMQVAGIDTYYNSGDSDYIIPHHIDFISMNTIGEYILFNGGASNNGTASEPNPWLASGVYAVLNGVNNYTTSAYNSLKHGYNASSTGGVLQMLPDDLQDVIITKRTWAEEQYSSSALVNYPTGYGWKDYGYLWVPHEVEVCGYQPNSYNRGEGSTLDNLTRGLNKMYPLYRYATRVRTSADDNETRQAYWLCVPSGNAATNVCFVGALGYVNHNTAANSSYSVCFGFRIG